MMNTVRDNLIINDELVPITGGSFGEGLDLRGGDIDIIHAHRLIDVSEHRKFPFDDRRTYLKMETETIQAGYTMLRCISTHNNKVLQCCKKKNGKNYFSNVSYKERLLLDQTMPMVIHGPCLSNEQADFDIAQALHKCRDSLRDLQTTIKKSDRIEDPTAKALSFICLGIAFQLLGNEDSARNAFIQAYAFESYGIKEIATKRLSRIK
ncbi:unnamed protein product [Mytilus edulis]|uniref:Uncharacterized protein n=1 Tax=Mytilus edulis TaxID=6550 RepID=A0A8S3VCC9_MYTED|nr:unnamed protein product [Mytilus edulis]